MEKLASKNVNALISEMDIFQKEAEKIFSKDAEKIK